MDFVFETSWEVCNKVGGIHTVLSSKARDITVKLGERYLLIGPDVWKEPAPHPQFVEDEGLFAEWKKTAWENGLKVKAGHWNIAGKPQVILIDFTPFYERKNEVFARLWELYRLDSLNGRWDYIEPAIFGYAAGKVVESFHNFHFPGARRCVAHFHEWMTGTGILYLKEKLPQMGTVFTTHATVLGRTIAGNGLPLYADLEKYEPSVVAQQFNVVSKNSLETLAAKHADCFTTVSGITARECTRLLGKTPDVLTLNGFGEQIAPKGETRAQKRSIARQKALQIAAKLTGKQYKDGDTLLVLSSGRYEFKNKGLDLYIKSLAKLNGQGQPENAKKIVAFVAVPAGQHGPANNFSGNAPPNGNKHLTHKLNDPQHDPVLQTAIQCQLNNLANDWVDLIFLPAYLNGNDGVANLDYYDFLTGFDLTVFPSYYEPWGYTPLESVAFGIPTATTTFAGFGAWVEKHFELPQQSILVLQRSEGDDQPSIDGIAGYIYRRATSGGMPQAAGDELQRVCEQALWKKMIAFYLEAWQQAAEKSDARKPKLPEGAMPDIQKLSATIKQGKPEWRKVLVQTALPEKLLPLRELAFNLWWCWNDDAVELFKSISPDAWEACNHNPIALASALSKDELDELANDKGFQARLAAVHQRFKAYMNAPGDGDDKMVAYFCMEYGLHETLRIYSGGLGILAGDYLKQASDSRKRMVGVGLMYRHGYFDQSLSVYGDQLALYPPQHFSELPLLPLRNGKGEWVTVKIAMPGRTIEAKAWQLNVGRIPLYLLDTDIGQNSPEDRTITHQLYGGDRENRLKQEMVLGIGGVRLLNAIGLEPQAYHNNEGHAAFSCLERVRRLTESEPVSYQTAVELVKGCTLFTTHTPVPAGHDVFEEHLMRAYLSNYCEYFGISWKEFMGLGRVNPNDTNEKFSMSILAAKLSQEVNGVSKIHGEVTRKMLEPLYAGYYAHELHIGHVTNGVHYPSWTNALWKKLYSNTFGQGFEENQPDRAYWSKIYGLPDAEIFETKRQLKRRLVAFAKAKCKSDLTKRQESPKVILNALSALDEDTLIIGFARRFATYKRAHLLFSNLGRLASIVNKPDMPVVFLFAGKAHPHDKAGQDLIKRIVEISKRSEFEGKVVFLEDYNIALGRMLTSGVDVWLNTPTRPLEASGTSGEKAVMNGVMNFSVLDGWWAEGYAEGAGWAIEQAKSYANQQFQDELDAEVIYNTLEREIVPMYYRRNEGGVPEQWVRQMKNTIAKIAPHFTMQRMLDDYYTQFYEPLFARKTQLYANDQKLARELVAWKGKVADAWNNLGVVSLTVPNANKGALPFGKHFYAELVLNAPGLEADDLGVDVLFGNKTDDGGMSHLFAVGMEAEAGEGDTIKFRCDFPLKRAGVMDYALRIHPKSKLLRHRTDFPLVKWV